MRHTHPSPRSPVTPPRSTAPPGPRPCDGHDAAFAGLAVRPRLSPAERRVAVLLATDLSRGQIAVELYLSLNTVKTHVRRIYRALGVATRGDAVEVLRRYGYLER